MKKALLALALLTLLLIPLTSCSYGSGDILSQLQAWLEDYKENQEDEDDSDDGGGSGGGVILAITYPAGYSPNVFTSGWVFGARCSVSGKDYSNQVQWSGSGSFSPNVGNRSRPTFSGPGSNTITLTVKVGEKDYSKSFKVNAVSSAGYACVGMIAQCPADSHGCPADPLPVRGPITTGSSQVFINGKPAARVGDRGVHAACAGSNTFEIVGGDSSVLINGRSAAKIGSTTRHCGGMGHIIGVFSGGG